MPTRPQHDLSIGCIARLIGRLEAKRSLIQDQAVINKPGTTLGLNATIAALRLVVDNQSDVLDAIADPDRHQLLESTSPGGWLTLVYLWNGYIPVLGVNPPNGDISLLVDLGLLLRSGDRIVSVYHADGVLPRGSLWIDLFDSQA